MFIKYIEQGINAGVDYLIIGDIGAILLLKEMGVKVPIIASTFFETINFPQIEFLISLGVPRVVLSYHVTLKEIEELIKKTDKKVQFEIFGHYGCSFFENCNFKHTFGELNNMGIGVPCLNSYNIHFNNNEVYSGQVLNASLNCSLCSMPFLYNMGVYSIKLVGRDKNIKMNTLVTEIYAKLLNFIEDNKDNFNYDEYLALKDQLIPDWWNLNWCKLKSCKYLENKVTESYTGIN
jgi:putative protease